MKKSMGGSDGKASVYNARDLGQEDPLEMEMAIHSSSIAWKIPWTEEPGRLQSTGSQRLGHDRVDTTRLYTQTNTHYLILPESSNFLLISQVRKKNNHWLIRNKILTYAETWMTLEDIISSEISQSQKKKYCMISLYETLKAVKITETENKMVVARDWGKGV